MQSLKTPKYIIFQKYQFPFTRRSNLPSYLRTNISDPMISLRKKQFAIFLTWLHKKLIIWA